MQCSFCGTSLPAGVTVCPNCGNRIYLANPTPSITPQQGTFNAHNNAISPMDFGPLQETSSFSSQAEPASPPGRPYQPDQPQYPDYQQRSQQPQQPQPIQQQHMIFGPGASQTYSQTGTPPLQPQYPQHPQQSSQWAQQPATTFGLQGYSQSGLPPQQSATFPPGQSYSGYSGAFPPPQQPPGTFGQEQFYPTTGMPQQQQAGIYPPGQFAQPAQPVAQMPGQHRRPSLSTGMLVLLVILVIAIIGGSGIVLYTTVLLPANQHSQAGTHPTTQAKTPIVQATTPITTTNPQDLYTQITGQTPTLNDPLTGQDNNNWLDLSTLKTCTFTGGALHLNGSSSSCIGEGTNFSNFAYQVKVTIIQGVLGGIAFRIDALDRKLYFFAINPDGLYVVVYAGAGASGSNNERLLASASSSAITTGLNQQNTLAVIARGSSIYLYINTQYITTITDSSSTIGAIGMLGGSSSSGSNSNVAFSDAKVWTL